MGSAAIFASSRAFGLLQLDEPGCHDRPPGREVVGRDTIGHLADARRARGKPGRGQRGVQPLVEALQRGETLPGRGRDTVLDQRLHAAHGRRVDPLDQQFLHRVEDPEPERQEVVEAHEMVAAERPFRGALRVVEQRHRVDRSGQGQRLEVPPVEQPVHQVAEGGDPRRRECRADPARQLPAQEVADALARQQHQDVVHGAAPGVGDPVSQRLDEIITGSEQLHVHTTLLAARSSSCTRSASTGRPGNTCRRMPA